MMLLRLALLVLAAVLGGCTATAPATRTAGFAYKGFDTAPLAYAGRTIVFHDPFHGTQVEYYAANGDTFLWYPGNRRSLKGRWERRPATEEVCFRYGPRTYNPVTGSAGSRWSCIAQASHRASARGSCAGDPFKLASGRLPFALAKPKRERARTVSRSDRNGGPGLKRVLTRCGDAPARGKGTAAPTSAFDAAAVSACRASFPSNVDGCGCLPKVTPRMNRPTREFLLASLRAGGTVGVRARRGTDMIGIGQLVMNLRGNGTCT